MTERILIVEDDKDIGELEQDYMHIEGWETRLCVSGTEALRAVKEESWNLIILDIMLPGINGYQLVQEFRKLTGVPIIMVSARKEEVDVIKGLSLGADDYIKKPFSPGELVARIKTHLSRYKRLTGHQAPEPVINSFNIKLYPNKRRVLVGEQEVALTLKEFNILYLLMENPGRVFSREDIFNRIWVEEFGDISTVTVHIRNLREKIEENPACPEKIETVWGLGYRWHET